MSLTFGVQLGHSGTQTGCSDTYYTGPIENRNCCPTDDRVRRHRLTRPTGPPVRVVVVATTTTKAAVDPSKTARIPKKFRWCAAERVQRRRAGKTRRRGLEQFTTFKSRTPIDSRPNSIVVKKSIHSKMISVRM